jgi:hypothetical protein
MVLEGFLAACRHIEEAATPREDDQQFLRGVVAKMVDDSEAGPERRGEAVLLGS